jgi:hypothetical protein
MPKPKSPPSGKGERRMPSPTHGATDHSPKGTPTEDRHTTETAGGQHQHDARHTTDNDADRRRNGS